jgi:hypothetical protein
MKRFVVSALMAVAASAALTSVTHAATISLTKTSLLNPGRIRVTYVAPGQRWVEVWVQSNGRDPVKLFEDDGDGQGTRVVFLPGPGTHVLILTEDGKELATAKYTWTRKRPASPAPAPAPPVNDVGQPIDQVVASGYVGDPQKAPFLYFEWPKKPGEFRLGRSTLGVWCDLEAQYDIRSVEARRDGRLIFHGFITIVPTRERDRITVEQRKDKSGLTITRHLSGKNAGKTQVGNTFPPVVVRRNYTTGIAREMVYSNQIETPGPAGPTILRPQGPGAGPNTAIHLSVPE